MTMRMRLRRDDFLSVIYLFYYYDYYDYYDYYYDCLLLLLFVPVLRVTTAKVYNDSVEIWKYQRYGMIVDFEERLVLPPPFTILCYAFFILRWIGHFVYRAVARLYAHTRCCGPHADYKVGNGEETVFLSCYVTAFIC